MQFFFLTLNWPTPSTSQIARPWDDLS